jgi:predicted N-acetyltransferase YhbS
MTDAHMPTLAFTLRPIVTADAEAAASLIRNTFASIAPPLVPPPSAQIAAGGGAVAEASGMPVSGMPVSVMPVRVILWGERDGGLYFGRLSVAPGWRRTGVARALIGSGEGVAQPTWVEMEKLFS